MKSAYLNPRTPKTKRIPKRGYFRLATLETYWQEQHIFHNTFNDMMDYMVAANSNRWTCNLYGGSGLTMMIPQLVTWKQNHPEIEFRASQWTGMVMKYEIGKIVIEDFSFEYKCMEDDPEILAKRVSMHQDWVWDTFGVMPGSTMGGTARKIFAAHLPKGKGFPRKCKSTEDWLRMFCHGTIISPGYSSLKQENIRCLDANGMFASVMRWGEYPDPSISPTFTTGSGRIDAWWQVKIECDPSKVDMPFVYMFDGDNNPLGMVYGTGRAYLTPILREAAEAAGYKILDWEVGCIWHRTCDPFSKLVDLFEQVEYAEDTHPDDVKWIKGIRTRLNGSFNQGNTFERVVFSNDLPDDTEPMWDEDGMPIDGTYVIEETLKSPFVQPAWYALTIQRAAVVLAGVLAEIPQEFRFTSHTDSVNTPDFVEDYLVDNEVIEIGPGYGKWKSESRPEFQGWHLNYWYRDEFGGEHYKNGAMPEGVTVKNGDEFKRALNGEDVGIEVSWLPRTIQGLLGGEMERVRGFMRPQDVPGYHWNELTGVFTPLNVGVKV